MTHTFEQQPRESAKAFAAFTEYLHLGPQRSLAAVGQKLGKSLVLIERWSSRWQWTERVAAHAAYLAEIERLAIQERAVAKAVEWDQMTDAVRREAWRKSEELMKMTDDFLERWRKCARVPGFESVVRGIELAIKLKQFAAGMPSEIKEVTGEVKATLSVEWESALAKIYGAKKPAGVVVDAQIVPEPVALPAPATGEVTP